MQELWHQKPLEQYAAPIALLVRAIRADLQHPHIVSDYYLKNIPTHVDICPTYLHKELTEKVSRKNLLSNLGSSMAASLLISSQICVYQNKHYEVRIKTLQTYEPTPFPPLNGHASGCSSHGLVGMQVAEWRWNVRGFQILSSVCLLIGENMILAIVFSMPAGKRYLDSVKGHWINCRLLHFCVPNLLYEV